MRQSFLYQLKGQMQHLFISQPTLIKIKRFVSFVYPEFFFELVLYPGEETKGPTSQGVM